MAAQTGQQRLEQYRRQGDRHATIPLASIPVEMAIADLYHRL